MWFYHRHIVSWGKHLDFQPTRVSRAALWRLCLHGYSGQFDWNLAISYHISFLETPTLIWFLESETPKLAHVKKLTNTFFPAPPPLLQHPCRLSTPTKGDKSFNPTKDSTRQKFEPNKSSNPTKCPTQQKWFQFKLQQFTLSLSQPSFIISIPCFQFQNLF